jgi:hypothetical protein
MSRFGAGTMSGIAVAIAGVAFMALQLGAQSLGFEDTDNPAVQLEYLRGHSENYAQQGLAMFVIGIALTILVFAAYDRLAGQVGPVALRTLSAFGLLGAACYFLFGVMRFSVLPLLYIDGLDHDWGEMAYLVHQVAGIHGFAQAGIVSSCGFAVGIGIAGFRAGVLPRWLAVLAVVPAIRLLAIVGPFGLLPDGFWIIFMLSIPGSFVWFALLGASLRDASAAAANAARTPALAEG